MSNIGVFDINQLRVDEIVITNAAIDNPTGLTRLEDDKYIFDVNYSFKTAVSLVLKKLKIAFSCEIDISNKEKVKLGLKGKFEVTYFFDYEDLENLVTVSPVLEINSDLISSATNIVYSTSRGIIYTRCQGTILSKAILPIVSTNKLMESLED